MALGPFLLAVAALSSLAATCALGSSLPPGACTPQTCAKAASVMSQSGDARASSQYVGVYLGNWNKKVSNSRESQVGGPILNYQVYLEVGYNGTILAATSDTNIGDCCRSCSLTYGCSMYQFFESAKVSKGKQAVVGFKEGYQCYLLWGGSDFTKQKEWGEPKSGTADAQTAQRKTYDASWLGGMCNLCYPVKK